MLFLGTFEHSLDTKNRLTFPSKMRAKFQDTIVISKGFDGCLEIRTPEQFEDYSTKLTRLSNTKKDSRAIVRGIFANSSDIQIDSSSRILLPQNLLEIANIQKNVVVIGAGNRLELWDVNEYRKYQSANDAKFEEIAERLEDDE